MSDQPFWENDYNDLESATFGEPSAEIVELATTLPKNSRILDLGCGDGRNALFLARHGFEVTAIDISLNGIRKLKQLAGKEGLEVDARIADMVDFEMDARYDLVIAHGSLHLIARHSWQRLIDRMQDATSGGGYNVIAVFTDTLPIPDDLRPFAIGLFRSAELFDYFADWITISATSYVLEDEHPGGIRHRHAIDKIVARKHE
jgi:tellurite methyltransferase